MSSSGSSSSLKRPVVRSSQGRCTRQWPCRASWAGCPPDVARPVSRTSTFGGRRHGRASGSRNGGRDAGRAVGPQLDELRRRDAWRPARAARADDAEVPTDAVGEVDVVRADAAPGIAEPADEVDDLAGPPPIAVEGLVPSVRPRRAPSMPLAGSSSGGAPSTLEVRRAHRLVDGRVRVVLVERDDDRVRPDEVRPARLVGGHGDAPCGELRADDPERPVEVEESPPSDVEHGAEVGVPVALVGTTAGSRRRAPACP